MANGLLIFLGFVGACALTYFKRRNDDGAWMQLIGGLSLVAVLLGLMAFVDSICDLNAMLVPMRP